MPRLKKQPVAPISAPQEAVAATPAPIQPLPPSPAVLALQSQVVRLVDERTAARQRVTECHAAYLTAGAAFQAAEGALHGIEQEVQYRIDLIARMENRAPVPGPVTAPAPQMPTSLAGISSEPTGVNQGANFAISPLMTRRDVMGMM